MVSITEYISDYRKRWDRHLDRIKNTRTPKKIYFRIQGNKGQKSNAAKKMISILKPEEAVGILHEEKEKKTNFVIL